MNEKLTRFDGHCHFFNFWYLAEELVAIGSDAISGNYPRRPAAGPSGLLGAEAGNQKKSILDAIETLMRQIAQAAGVLVGDYEANYKLLRSNYQTVFGQDTELSAIPLMMDIYYMFAPSAGGKALVLFPPKGASRPRVAAESAATAAPQDPKAEFDLWFAGIKSIIVKAAAEGESKYLRSYRDTLAAPRSGLIIAELNRIYGDVTAPSNLLRGKACPAVMTPGYEREIRNCLRFQAMNRGKVFPFLSFDPRRQGVIDLIKDGSYFGIHGPLVSPDGPFYGVKLYPRLGYLPKDIGNDLLEWCSETDTPMTAHTSPGGFPVWPWAWPWDDYGNPKNWEPVIGAFAGKGKAGGLRLDLAHFGGDDADWRDGIAKIIADTSSYGPNIHSDVACFTKKPKLAAVRAKMDANAALRDRVLFGTDFDVMLLTDLPIDVQTYLRQYVEVFGGTDDRYDHIPAMMGSTPRAFLKLPAAGLVGGKAWNAAAPSGVSPQRARIAFRESIGKRYGLGWLRDLPDIRDYTTLSDAIPAKQRELSVTRSVRNLAYPLMERQSGRLPERTDLREWCSGVEDQKNLGACTANAVVGLVEYFENRASGKYIDASRLFLYKVTRKLLGIQGDMGAYLRTTLQAMVLFGVPPESAFPYAVETFDEEPVPFAYAYAQNYKTLSYYRLDPPGISTDKLLSEIKTALAAGLPAAFGFSTYDSMGEAESSGRVPLPSANDRFTGGHAVMAVGYDDDLEITNGDPGSLATRGAILFRNSWGDWGDEGYGWLPYDYVLRGLTADWWSIIKQDWVDTGAFD